MQTKNPIIFGILLRSPEEVFAYFVPSLHIRKRKDHFLFMKSNEKERKECKVWWSDIRSKINFRNFVGILRRSFLGSTLLLYLGIISPSEWRAIIIHSTHQVSSNSKANLSTGCFKSDFENSSIGVVSNVYGVFQNLPKYINIWSLFSLFVNRVVHKYFKMQ